MKNILLPVLLALVMNLKAGIGEIKDLPTRQAACKLKIGDTYAGGIVFYIKSAATGCHGLVCAAQDQAEHASWADARDLCQNLNLESYNDWRLPTQDELDKMYTNLFKASLGNFATAYYWSVTIDANNLAYSQYFVTAYQNVFRFVHKEFLFHVRAVREF